MYRDILVTQAAHAPLFQVAVVAAFVALVAVAHARPQAQEPTPKPIAILKLASDVQPDGSFTYE